MQPIMVVSYENVIKVLKLCVAIQSWVNMVYSRGLSSQPWGVLVLSVSMKKETLSVAKGGTDV